MKFIQLDENDSKRIAHYSPAVEHNNILYVSGQLPIPKGMKSPSSEEIEKQTEIVLEKLKEILITAGSDIDKVLKTTIYVTDIEHWDKVNAVYAKFFGDHRPARTIVPTKTLHYNCLIELDAIAYKE
ncbi:MAG: RidA family protein [Asgard group archaeon]|nr:RidA family protein [Asgard group archaeon]